MAQITFAPSAKQVACIIRATEQGRIELSQAAMDTLNFYAANPNCDEWHDNFAKGMIKAAVGNVLDKLFVRPRCFDAEKAQAEANWLELLLIGSERAIRAELKARNAARGYLV